MDVKNSEESLDEFYFSDYNNLISNVALEFQGAFPATASPTLSKQETVTFLYRSVQKRLSGQRQAAFPFLQLLQFVPRLAFLSLRLCYVSACFKVKDLPCNTVYFRSWLEPRCIKEGVISDEHFRGVVEKMAHGFNVRVGLQPYNYSLLTKLHGLNQQKNFIVPIGLLDIKDIFSLMIDYIRNAWLRLTDHYFLNGVDISREINRSLLLDYLGMRSFVAYQEKYICKKLLAYNLKAFIYVYENQSWEKVCCDTFKGSNTALIGIQGSGFSPVFLNFFPTELDAKNNPMPDVIFTVGDLFSSYLVRHGHYDVPVRTFAAVRFPYPNDCDRYLVKPPNPIVHSKILYAFSVHTSQYSDIVMDLISVFDGLDIEVDLKFHPQFSIAEIIKLESLPGNFFVVNELDMNTLSDNYDLVLFNDNSFGIESMLMGVRSYQYNRYNIFNDERLFDFKLWDTHLDYHGLRAIRDKIINKNYVKNYSTDELSEYLNLMYKPFNGNIDKLINYFPRNV